MPFWTYILRCSDGSYYVGHTDALDGRMAAHGAGTGSEYTAKRLPLELLWSTNFQTRDEAFFLERKLKGWSRAKKEAFMREDWAALPPLSKTHGAGSTLRQAQGERGGKDDGA
jgi:predicted GIY-YIG superfamily endonuclease